RLPAGQRPGAASLVLLPVPAGPPHRPARPGRRRGPPAARAGGAAGAAGAGALGPDGGGGDGAGKRRAGPGARRRRADRTAAGAPGGGDLLTAVAARRRGSHFAFKSRVLTSFAVGKSSGTFCVTLPVAAHSAPRCSVTMKPTHLIAGTSWPSVVWNTRP